MARVTLRLAGVAAFALAMGMTSTAASAQGLHLKLSSDSASVPAEQTVKVKVVAVALRTLSLPETPVFLIDDGSGPKPLEGAKALEAGAVDVTPDRSHAGDYELALPKPGNYKLQVEYRVDGRPVRSNKVALVVTAGDARAGQ